MDKNKIIPVGTVAKFQVVIDHEEFDQELHDYSITLKYGLMGGERYYDKSDMIVDEDGNVFLVFDTSGMVGRVTAECRYEVPDTDMESGVREEVDIQLLCFVAVTPCVQLAKGCCPDDEQHHVTYTRVYRSDANTLYLNLRTEQKEPIVDTDGQQLRVRKSEEDLH